MKNKQGDIRYAADSLYHGFDLSGLSFQAVDEVVRSGISMLIQFVNQLTIIFTGERQQFSMREQVAEMTGRH